MLENITLEEFLEEVSKEVSNKYPENIVTINQVTKNNGLVLHGLCIQEEGSNVVPTIYLDDYYSDYTNGRDVESIAETVYDSYEKGKVGQIDMNFFMNYDIVKNMICYKVVNTERNTELLDNVPHVEHSDLSIVFYCKISNPEFGFATIQISNSHMDIWGVNTEELMKIAEENTPKLLPLELKSMEQVMRDILSENIKNEFTQPILESMQDDRGIEPPDEYFQDVVDEIFQCMHENEVPMYVLTNTEKANGAAAMLYPHALDDFANVCGGDFYLLPSSVHELILVPKKNDDMEKLNDMVKEVNYSQVSREEVLADHAYFYDAAKKELLTSVPNAKVAESEMKYGTEKQQSKPPTR